MKSSSLDLGESSNRFWDSHCELDQIYTVQITLKVDLYCVHFDSENGRVRLQNNYTKLFNRCEDHGPAERDKASAVVVDP